MTSGLDGLLDDDARAEPPAEHLRRIEAEPSLLGAASHLLAIATRSIGRPAYRPTRPASGLSRPASWWSSSRPVYAGVAELSIYVHPAARGRGVGPTLLRALIDAADAAGIWTLETGIFPENVASVALHRHAGFTVVGRRDRIGRHHGVWRDVLLLERRSPTVG